MDYSSYRSDLSVGFRVEVHDKQHRSENNTSRWGKGSMVARDPSRDLDDPAFKDHLIWGYRRAGPLISFTCNWNEAMERRKKFIGEGAKNVVVIAVWLKGLDVYDAYRIARRLDMEDPDKYNYELLLHDSIYADSYRILAMFHGVLPLEDVVVSFPGGTFDASIPGGFAHSTKTSTTFMRTLRNATDDFKNETYSLTGIRGGVKLGHLLSFIRQVPTL